MCHRTLLDGVELWHQRLGHVNFKDLHRITQHEIVRGVPKLANGQGLICGRCMKGKQTKAQHKNTNVVGTTRCLELFHIDHMGPSRTESLEEKRYIIIVVDDLS